MFVGLLLMYQGAGAVATASKNVQTVFVLELFEFQNNLQVYEYL